MKVVAIIVFLFFGTILTGRLNAHDYKIDRDTSGKAMIIGDISWAEWHHGAEWKSYKDTAYHPDTKIVNKLKNLLKSDISFDLFAGSWCGDSRDNLPKIYQLMDELGISDERIELTGVDRQKKDLMGKAQGMAIKLVPTLIIMKDGNEAGRIEENPHSSWEEDLLEILSR